MTFICDIKILILWVNLIVSSFMWTSFLVQLFDFLTFYIILKSWHLLDILTSFWQFDIFLTLTYYPDYPSPSQGYFLILRKD